jgi:hypothetical protein
MIVQRATKPSRYLGLGMFLFFAARLAGWDSPWFGPGAFALGVSAVVIALYERREKGADDPAVLDLHR